MTKDKSQLKVGVLGAGPIAQAAHFESCAKARNVELHAICDVADDLLERMAAIWMPARTFCDYDQMLADPDLDAVIIATSDAFHVPAALAALGAGKHVLCEKPVAVGIDEAAALAAKVKETGLVLQIGHMKRFDPGIQSARAFIAGGMGQMQALKAWYCDSTYRYTMTDAVQPKPLLSSRARKPTVDPKANKQQYYMLAHGSHLIDLARFLGGPIEEVDARLNVSFGAYCWFVDIAYASGALGHLDLTIPVRMDWYEGFQIYGEHGAITAKTYNPWYFKASDVDIFHNDTGQSTRVLGADGHSYRRQLEAFADVVQNDAPMTGASIEDGVASVRAMAAIRQSVETRRPVRLSDAEGVA